MLNIITPNIRSIYLTAAYNSIKPFVNGNNIRWYIVNDFDGPNDEFNSTIYPWLLEDWIMYLYHKEHCWGHPQRNYALNRIKSGWVCFLDDDNLMHPDFYPTFAEHMNDDLHGIIFKLCNKDGIIEAKPENVRIGGIDISQYVLRREFIGDERLAPPYFADGMFIHKLYHEDQSKKFLFLNDKVRCYHNFMRSRLIWKIPSHQE